jgi:uncharacterized protein (DUF433 family)
MDVRDYIAVDQEICHGKPCFKGTRVMVSIVLELLEAGEDDKEILAGYPQLTSQHIKAALHYAAEVVDSEKFMPTH